MRKKFANFTTDCWNLCDQLTKYILFFFFYCLTKFWFFRDQLLKFALFLRLFDKILDFFFFPWLFHKICIFFFFDHLTEFRIFFFVHEVCDFSSATDQQNYVFCRWLMKFAIFSKSIWRNAWFFFFFKS